MPRRRCIALGISLAVAVPLALLGSPASAAPGAAKPYDINGDGRPDLVAGAPFLQVGSVDAAGGVAVLSASRSGLASKAKVVTAATPDVVGTPNGEEELGAAVAVDHAEVAAHVPEHEDAARRRRHRREHRPFVPKSPFSRARQRVG